MCSIRHLLFTLFRKEKQKVIHAIMPTIRQVLGLLRVQRLNVNKAIGIKQQRGLKKMSKKKKINLAISIAQVVVQALILYNTYQQYKYSKKYSA